MPARCRRNRRNGRNSSLERFESRTTVSTVTHFVAPGRTEVDGCGQVGGVTDPV